MAPDAGKGSDVQFPRVLQGSSQTGYLPKEASGAQTGCEAYRSRTGRVSTYPGGAQAASGQRIRCTPSMVP